MAPYPDDGGHIGDGFHRQPPVGAAQPSQLRRRGCSGRALSARKDAARSRGRHGRGAKPSSSSSSSSSSSPGGRSTAPASCAGPAVSPAPAQHPQWLWKFRSSYSALYALVCLHSGVFLRSQYLAFIGRTNPALANRFVRRCRKHAVEQPWNGYRLRICRISARRIYRLIGAEHIRHRRPAAPDMVARRLLSLDYVVEHPHAAWLRPSTRR